MPRAADGQYEMVLENRHVMTLFFVVVMLCGVFFGLGYIVGKNAVASVPPQQQAQEAAAKDAAKKSPLDAAEKKPDTPDLTYQKTLEDNSASPALETPRAAAPAPTQQAPVAATPAPRSAAPASAAPAAARAPATSGTIIQVGALKNRSDADSMAFALKDKGFSPVVEQQTDGLFHVIVPVASANDADDVKARVEKAGFKAFIKKK